VIAIVSNMFLRGGIFRSECRSESDFNLTKFNWKNLF